MTLDFLLIRRMFLAVHVCMALWVLLATCDSAGADARTESAALSTQDSLATHREMEASLSGGVAPGRQAYAFRGLYAGLSRAQLESRVHAPATCHPAESRSGDLSCVYESTLGSDSARVRVEVELSAEDARGERIAHTVTVSRELPLDVDGVRLARELAGAFEAQTAMLDKRDASFGHRQAQVRMGTVSGARRNFVELTVSPLAGRELLTVKMSRR